jgi:hypothetical protein
MKILDDLLKELADLATQQANAIAVQAAAERGAGWVREFESEFPAASALIARLVQGTPEDVLQRLERFSADYRGISQMPVAKVFVSQLQAALRGKQ